MANRKLLIISSSLLACSLLVLLFALTGPRLAPQVVPDVQLSVDKWTYKPGETVTATITNLGPNTYSFGYGFGYSQRLFNTWISPVNGPRQGGVLAIAFMLYPGRSFPETISLGGVVPGVYRVSKYVGPGIVYTEFTVEGRDPLPFAVASILLAEVAFLAVALLMPEEAARTMAPEPKYDYVRTPE